MTSTSPGKVEEEASELAHLVPLHACPTQLLTLGMGPVGNAQGSRVSVHSIGDHPVKDVASWGKPVTGQKSHDARVTVVELGKARNGGS